jgi:Fe2+ or Zn2+ uptake regulation protein
VAGVLPGVSPQTIYATLALFEELGLVRRVLAMSGAAMFDSRPDPHHHTSCRGCGEIADLEAPAPMESVLAVAQDGGFRPDGASVTVVGLCASCAARVGAGERGAPLTV